MIYHLTEYLKEIGIDIPGQGLFNYLSFRAIISFTFALLIVVLCVKPTGLFGEKVTDKV